MRAGLLSNPLVIERVNQDFVSTWILIDEARRLAKQGDPLVKTLASEWEYPMDLMFLNSDAQLISKLNSFKDLKAAHPDVAHPPSGRGQTPPHITVFLEHLDKHFAKDSARSAGNTGNRLSLLMVFTVIAVALCVFMARMIFGGAVRSRFFFLG